MKEQNLPIRRRQFLQQSMRTGLLASGGLSVVAERLAQAGGSQSPGNRFAYDVERLRKTDPKHVHYEQVAILSCPYPDSHRIVAGPENRLYIAAGNEVIVLDLDGAKMDEIVTASPARCLAIARDGTLYVGLRDHVEVFDPKNQRLATWQSPGKKTWLTGLTVAENDLFAADAGARVVWRYDTSGKLVGRIGEKNRERNVPGFVVPSPYLDVELGKDGLLRLNNPGRHRIETYTVEGDFEGAWGKPTSALEGFCGCCNPIGIALLPDGRLVTCEKGLPRVKVYSIDGAFESVVAGAETFPENARACADLNDCTRGGMDATVDALGRIYILDFVTQKVRVMKHKTAA